jgi:very-short-patch-repair endonuclease
MKIPILGPVLLLLILAVLAVLLRKGPRALSDPWPLEVRRTVLSPPEQILYRRLVQALPQNLVFAQVQLSRFLQVRRGVPRLTWLNRINQMSADFLVLNPDTSVVAAIELDDASHDRSRRRDTDARKAHALQSAGVRLIRWHVKSLPDDVAIRAAVAGTTTTGRPS